MKKAILLFLVISITANYGLIAQVAVNTDGSAPNPSAGLDVKFNNKGFLPPRVADTNAISTPAEGLMVYDMSSHCMRYYNGNRWSECMGIYIWSCGDPITIFHVVSEGVAPVDKTVTYATVTNIPGETSKCWITRNLGASQQATAVSDATEAPAGWYWQFNHKQGYKHDGTTRTPNTTWITPINEGRDWQADNDPCTLELGSDWRIPTYTEWVNVDAYWTDWNGPWYSGLKMHAAGILSNSSGSLSNRGLYGHYWGSTQNSSTHGWSVGFGSTTSNMTGHYKAYGFTLRCLKD